LRIWDGIAVSPGIAIAPAFPMESEEFTVTARPVAPESVEEEIARFHEAVAAAVEDVDELRRSSGMTGELGQIFDAHRLILTDRKIHGEVVQAIRDARLPAEYCVRQVYDHQAGRLAALEDEYFADRARDVKDIEYRILRRLSGARQMELACLTEMVIVVARDLTPSQTAGLDKEKVLGIGIDMGGRTSHTAIVARSLGIPAVVGLKDFTATVEQGVQVVIDGNRGRVVVDPDSETLAAYERLKGEFEAFRESLTRSRHLKAETLDGHSIKLFGNIERPQDATAVLKAGGDGVGLFRTEFLFVEPGSPPSEEEHYRAYKEAVERLEGRPIVIRTLDLGGDKVLADPTLARERNPFMGLRSLRYCLTSPEVFLPQLKAILRAGAHGDVRIMFPMVSTVEEVRKAVDLLGEARDELRARKCEFASDLPVGVMVETPAAALAADLLAREVSFFSVGTNDLIQYALAVDRGNERVANLYQPAHPAILRLLRHITEVGRDEDVDVAVCGEICGEANYTLLLLGMGLKELSLVPAMIPQIKKVIRSLTMERAREVARTAITMSEAAQTERYLHASLRQILPMIF
jgi:phosphoenolpyruvate-protein phosphotransferase (PTS system enzyme I)